MPNLYSDWCVKSQHSKCISYTAMDLAYRTWADCDCNCHLLEYKPTQQNKGKDIYETNEAK